MRNEEQRTRRILRRYELVHSQTMAQQTCSPSFPVQSENEIVHGVIKVTDRTCIDPYIGIVSKGHYPSIDPASAILLSVA